MNEYRIRSTGKVVTEDEFRHSQDAVFPSTLTVEILDHAGLDSVLPSPAPTAGDFQTVSRDGVVQDTLGNWVWAWKITDLDADQIALAKDFAIEDKWTQIHTERDRRELAGFSLTIDGEVYWFHSDTESKTKHLGNKDTARDQLAAGGAMSDPLRDPLSGEQILWKTMVPGVWVPMTCQIAFDVVAAGKAAVYNHYKVAEWHRQRLLASDNPATYDFSTGWMKVFGEE